MATEGFLYFVPGRQRHTFEPHDVGLHHAFDRTVWSYCNVGPDGSAGALLCDSSLGLERLRYEPLQQTWVRCDQVWIGYYSMPTPDALLRPKQLPGHQVAINGQQWLIPAAQKYATNDGQLQATVALSRSYAFRDGQWFVGEVIDKYKALWAAAQKWFDVMIAPLATADETDEKPTMTQAEALGIAVTAIGTNYRIGAHEATILGLLTDESLRDINDALVDFPTVSALLKKKTQPEA